jgi:hypothetical protein
MTRTCWAIMLSATVGTVAVGTVAVGTGTATVSAAPPATAVPVSGGSYAPQAMAPQAMTQQAMPQPGCGEARYPYDAPEPWLHGYFQETPAYGGFHVFRPYNYKHVFAQSQIAAEWGASPTSPYSHQFRRANSQSDRPDRQP